jgi:carboxypeptidase Taq
VSAELAALRARAAELSDLRAIAALLFWDQNTVMPPGGAAPRADQLATLERTIHGRLGDPALAALLDSAELWAAGEDPDSDEVRLVRWLRRDHEKAVRVPVELAAEMSRAAALGQHAWLEARQAGDFEVFRPALERHLELRRRYVACFAGDRRYAHPYDVLLDDFEPGLTVAELEPLFGALREGLVPLVEAATGAEEDVLAGAFPVSAQRAAVGEVLAALGFERERWRLDEAVHPFAQGVAPTDVRITTRWDERDFGMALYSALHEFGHGLYEAQLDPRLYRTTLGEPVGLGVHESQSRLWENVVGRSRAFTSWLLPILRRHLEGFDGLDAAGFFRSVNLVCPSPIRIEADETTYNLHVVLRFELELALLEDRLAVAELPAAWDEGMERLLGVTVESALEGILQDIHWGAGMLGYFPTYTLGNLMAAQLWDAIVAELPAIEEEIARGEFGGLRGWLREHVHRHGRKYAPRELLERATGQELATEPFLRYLEGRLREAGVLADRTGVRGSRPAPT